MRTFLNRMTVFLVVLALPLTAFAGNAIGRPSGGGSSIEWHNNITGHERFTLTLIAPDGSALVKDIPAGRVPSVRLSDLGGSPADGRYNYELRVVPKVPEGIRRQLEAARAEGDDAAIRRLQKEHGLGNAVVQSGTITIINGMIVSPDATEADANDTTVSTQAQGLLNNVTADASRPPDTVRAMDQVIPDDLIVQSSICTGFDCVDGENFGFDTLRLKENNLRIHFEDTSTSAGFPANDWRIIANDSGSGGANKLSFEDSTAARELVVFEAAAPANSIYLDSTGNIGFNQSAPVLDLHMTQNDTPALRMEQSNAGGFTAQTWDIGANEANFFVRDVTGGSRLPLRIRPGATTSALDISSDGDIGINTASPNANTRIDVSDTTQAKARIVFSGQEYFQAANTATDGVALLLGANRTGNRQLWVADSSGLTQNSTNKAIAIRPNLMDISAINTDSTISPLTINRSGGFVGIATTSTPAFPLVVGDAGVADGNGAHVTTGGVWTSSSSRSFKQNIIELTSDEAQAAVAALKPVRYNYIREPNEQYVGFIAEDVPELVAQTSEERKYLSPMDVVATLTKVVQDQQKAMAEQQKTINELAKKIEQLESNK